MLDKKKSPEGPLVWVFAERGQLSGCKTRGQVSETVNDEGKSDWNLFSDEEKLMFQSTVLLVGLLYKMCGVNLVIDDDGDGSADRVNHDGINSVIDQSVDTARKIG